MTTRERFLRPLGRRKFKTPRAIVFAPYLNTLGGGERVIVAVAQLLQQSFAVALSGPRERDLGRWRGLGFPEMSVAVRSARQFTRETIRASLAVTMTNHVPLPSFAHRSFLIVQFPTDQIADFPAWKRVAGRWSLRRYSLLTYSQFNASFIEQRWGTADVVVLPPPVRQFPYEEAAKTNSILSVGRFTTSGNHKRQDALLEAWARLRPTLPTWHLVLAGAGSEDAPHVKQLRVRADEIGGVTIHVDATADLIAGLYQTASIYWHAAGYERPDDRPEKAEHFGMSTVEAMSAGAVYDRFGPVATYIGGAAIMSMPYALPYSRAEESVGARALDSARSRLTAPRWAPRSRRECGALCRSRREMPAS